MNQIGRLILSALQGGETTPERNLGRGLFWRVVVSEPPNLQIYRKSGETSPGEAQTVASALADALYQYVGQQHIITCSDPIQKQFKGQLLHGYKLTWKPDPNAGVAQRLIGE